jgi:hypothetical protein
MMGDDDRPRSKILVVDGAGHPGHHIDPNVIMDMLSRTPSKPVVLTTTADLTPKVVKGLRETARRRIKLEKAIAREIAKRKSDVCFLPDEYRKHRLAGLSPERIHYDMCHVFR